MLLQVTVDRDGLQRFELKYSCIIRDCINETEVDVDELEIEISMR